MRRYEYTVDSDGVFPNRKVALDRFEQEIRTSAITIALECSPQVINGNCCIDFKTDLSHAELLLLEQLIFNHSGEPLPLGAQEVVLVGSSTQGDGTPKVALAPRDGSEWVIGSHNFCDPCSWFGDSVRVTTETLTVAGNGLSATSVHPNWIDMTSGRMHNDDTWVEIQKEENPGNPHGYAVHVYSNGTELTRCPDFSETGGDYWVDYDAGTVNFISSQKNNVITASYSYATTNTFYVRPLSGTLLAVEDAECDVSSDVIMNATIAYSAWQYIEQLGGYASDKVYQFKRVGQLLTEARGCYSPYQAIAATEDHKNITDIREFRRKSRGMKYQRQAAPFQYSTVRWISSASKQEVRVFTSSPTVPMGGEHISITFYCTVKPEI